MLTGQAIAAASSGSFGGDLPHPLVSDSVHFMKGGEALGNSIEAIDIVWETEMPVLARLKFRVLLPQVV